MKVFKIYNLLINILYTNSNDLLMKYKVNTKDNTYEGYIRPFVI